MIPIDVPQANRVFTKPAEMTDEECHPLRVHDTGEAFISCWQLTPEERAEVERTGVVWLWVYGRGHPPVVVEGVSPFVETTPSPAPSLNDKLRAALDDAPLVWTDPAPSPAPMEEPACDCDREWPDMHDESCAKVRPASAGRKP